MLIRIEEELRSAVEPVVPTAQLRRAEEEVERLQAVLTATERTAAAESGRLQAALTANEQAAAAECERLNAALSAMGKAAAAEAQRLQAALTANEQTLTGVLASRSWGVTRPLRAATQTLHRLRK